MKKIIKITILLLVLSVSTNVIANSEDNKSLTKENKKEITTLKERLKIIENNKSNLDGKFENLSNSLEIKFEKIKMEFEKDYNYITLIVWVFGAVSIIGIIIMSISLYKYVIQVAKRKIDEKLDVFFDDRKEEFKQIINLQTQENILKTNKKIAVISTNTNDENIMKNYFMKMGFKDTDFIKISEFTKVRSDVDLIFFNNENGSITQPLIDEYFTYYTKNVFFFYYGQNRINDDKIDKHKVTMANRRSQIYGNIINALRYHEII